MYYSQFWLTSIIPSEAPSQDLTCLRTLEGLSCATGLWPEGIKDIAKAAYDKLRCHTWYLSERLVGLALFSDNVGTSTKETMRTAILKHNKKPAHTEQQRPECSSFLRRQLKHFVGPDTHTLFDLLHLKKDFLNQPASKWDYSSLFYQQNKSIVKAMQVVKDAAERALSLATTRHGQKMPRTEKHRQASLKVAYAMTKAQGSLVTSSEQVSKKNLNEFLTIKSNDFL